MQKKKKIILKQKTSRLYFFILYIFSKRAKNISQMSDILTDSQTKYLKKNMSKKRHSIHQNISTWEKQYHIQALEWFKTKMIPQYSP